MTKYRIGLNPALVDPFPNHPPFAVIDDEKHYVGARLVELRGGLWFYENYRSQPLFRLCEETRPEEPVRLELELKDQAHYSLFQKGPVVEVLEVGTDGYAFLRLVDESTAGVEHMFLDGFGWAQSIFLNGSGKQRSQVMFERGQKMPPKAVLPQPVEQAGELPPTVQKFNLEEADRILKEKECFREGHSWDVWENWYGPEIIKCSNCNEVHKINQKKEQQ